jgi:hypothetical protein
MPSSTAADQKHHPQPTQEDTHMNLIYNARAAVDACPRVARTTLSDAAISAVMTTQKAAVQATLDAATTELEVACAAAAHDAIESPEASSAASSIGGIVARITELEGRIQFFDSAIAGLA